MSHPIPQLKQITAAFATLLATLVALLSTHPLSAEELARAFIISPQNGETVSNPVTIQFGLQGMGVAPAGVERANTGHHHLLIDAADLPPLDQPLAGNVKHFGGGQTQTTIELSPGVHTLQLIVGDHLHRPHNPPVVSEKIKIYVEGQPLGGISIRNLKQLSPTVYRSGQPTKDAIKALSSQGIKHVINLRTDGEIGWDEAALVEKSGLRYYHLPISGASDITMENAEALSALLTGLQNEKTLVHCASSNRVGALIALQRGLNGMPVEQAIEEGKRWGLTRLEDTVRVKLEECEIC